MRGIQLVQSTIVYLEDHLFDAITLDDISRSLNETPYHINQTFTMITGMNPFEYLHRRKMTEAAEDILSGHARLIDIAEKYGFPDAHEFSRAFSEHHQLSPIQARTNNQDLNMLHRLYVQYSVTEEQPISYEIQEREPTRLVGYRIFLKNNELEHHFLIPDLLFEAVENGHFDRLKEINPDADIYLVTHPFQDGLDVFYGIRSDVSSELEPEYLHHKTFAVFNGRDHIDYVFNKIWQSIETHTDITLNYIHDDYYIAILPNEIDFDSQYTRVSFLLPIEG